MSTLNSSSMPLFENLFDMSNGYVLNFNNQKFDDFVYGVTKIDIKHSKYSINGDSKAKRLREFIHKESDIIVGQLLLSLIDYKLNLALTEGKDISNSEIVKKCVAIANRLVGKKIESETDLMNYEFKKMPIYKLGIESSILDTINQRILEIEICLKNKAALSCVLLCGSTLEGILLGLATNQIEAFNQDKSSPKGKDGKVLQLNKWTLNDFINVSFSMGLIDLNVKNYSHSLCGFRNYIHP